MAPVTGQAAVVDAGACGECGCGQWNHRLGKKGCKDPGCGCGKYEPPKDAPAEPEPSDAEVEAAETALDRDKPCCSEGPDAPHHRECPVGERPTLVVDPGSPVPGVVDVRPDDTDPGVPVGGFEPAEPGDADLPVAVEPTDDEVADEIDRAEATAEIERLHAELAEIRSALGVDEVTSPMEAIRAFGREITRLTTVLGDRTRERDGFEVQRDQAYERVDELTERARRLRRELNGANAGRLHAQDALDEAIRTGTTAAANVLFRYDADQCTTEGCGSRYTVPVDHQHPLTPVTVLVVRREVPGA
ncbi:hypothetical protein ACWER9_06670 [Micromonospora sp. NPDC003944]